MLPVGFCHGGFEIAPACRVFQHRQLHAGQSGLRARSRTACRAPPLCAAHAENRTPSHAGPAARSAPSGRHRGHPWRYSCSSPATGEHPPTAYGPLSRHQRQGCAGHAADPESREVGLLVMVRDWRMREAVQHAKPAAGVPHLRWGRQWRSLLNDDSPEIFFLAAKQFSAHAKAPPVYRPRRTVNCSPVLRVQGAIATGNARTQGAEAVQSLCSVSQTTSIHGAVSMKKIPHTRSARSGFWPAFHPSSFLPHAAVEMTVRRPPPPRRRRPRARPRQQVRQRPPRPQRPMPLPEQCPVWVPVCRSRS